MVCHTLFSLLSTLIWLEYHRSTFTPASPSPIPPNAQVEIAQTLRKLRREFAKPWASGLLARQPAITSNLVLAQAFFEGRLGKDMTERMLTRPDRNGCQRESCEMETLE
jgi:hypothetical protein